MAGFPAVRRMTSAMRLIALTGVRMSCDTDARKRVLRTFASSASRRRKSSSRCRDFCTLISTSAQSGFETPPLLTDVFNQLGALQADRRLRRQGFQHGDLRLGPGVRLVGIEFQGADALAPRAQRRRKHRTDRLAALWLWQDHV